MVSWCSALLVTACNLDNPGVSQDRGSLSYPIALTFGDHGHGPHRYLYVLNSNFNLRYNAGSVQAFDLAKIEKKIAPCLRLGLSGGRIQDLADAAAAGDASSAVAVDGGVAADASILGSPLGDDVATPPDYERASEHGTLRGVLCDGFDPAGEQRCCFDEDTLAQFFVGGPTAKGAKVLIDSFGSGLALSPDEKRLYATVRSRGLLLYLDVAKNGLLSCDDARGRCERGTSEGDEDLDPVRAQPAHPTAISVGQLSELTDAGTNKTTFIATAHETGEVSLFIDRGAQGPILESVLSTPDVRLTSITTDPVQKLFYVTNSRSGSVDRVGLRRQGKRLVLYGSTPLALTQVASGFDTRDVAIDQNDPERLFILMRGVTQSVLFGRVDPTTARQLRLEGEVRVGSGPSKMSQATLDGHNFLLVSCYDARSIYVIDQDRRVLTAIIRGFAGPFEMVVDEARKLLFVADFRANVLRVVDVQGLGDSRRPPPRIVATLGDLKFTGGLSQ